MRTAVSRSGATPRQIRHWEDRGWVGDVDRTPTEGTGRGRRVYSGQQFDWLRQIREWRDAGYSVEDIDAMVDEGAPPALLEELARSHDATAKAAADRARQLRDAAARRRRQAALEERPLAR